MKKTNQRVLAVLILSGFVLTGCKDEGGIDQCNFESGQMAQSKAITQKTKIRSFIDNRYIVKFKKNSTVNGARLLARSTPIHSEVRSIENNMFVVQIPAGADSQKYLKDLRENHDVETIEQDRKIYAEMIPNDQFYKVQWAHKVVQSEAAWDITQGSHDVTVAIIDTGIDYNHKDLAANMYRNLGETAGNGKDDDGDGYVDNIYGYNFIAKSGDPMVDDGPYHHGSHVAGIVGAVANNEIGVVGHSPKVKLMALKILDNEGSGQMSDAIWAVNYAVKAGAKIMNASFGTTDAEDSSLLAAALRDARDQDVLFVAAAGNGGEDGVGDDNDKTPHYPSNLEIENVIAVAATNCADQLASFSNYGIKSVDIAAPGQDIYSTTKNGKWKTLSGTSMATPVVAGVLSLMRGYRPDLNYKQITQALYQSSDKIPSLKGRIATGGRVNALKALQAIEPGTPGLEDVLSGLNPFKLSIVARK